jgi:hypothetical protein
MTTNVYLLSHLAQFVLEWKMFQTEVVETIKTHILNTITFENREVYDTMRKNNVQQSKTSHDNMTQAHCMLDA